MDYHVDIVEVEPCQLAAVRAHWDRSSLPTLITSSLDQVYAFLATAPQLVRGQNVVVYDTQMNIEAGVEATGSFEPAGNVIRTATPSGRAARAMHRGPYNRIGGAHDAVHAWCRAHGHKLTGISWEVYGDWAENESDLTTEVFWQLA